jgi:hypothetical protein
MLFESTLLVDYPALMDSVSVAEITIEVRVDFLAGSLVQSWPLDSLAPVTYLSTQDETF